MRTFVGVFTLAGFASASAAYAPKIEVRVSQPPTWQFETRGFTNITLPNDRWALVHISSTYDHTKSHPLILDFHGAGVGASYETIIDNVFNNSLRIAGSDIVTVYGQGTLGSNGLAWQGAPYSTGADDIAYTQAILDVVKGNLTIDKSRVYAVGFSNGGGFVNLLACTPSMAKNFAAFGTSSPALYAGTKAFGVSNETCDTRGHEINLIDVHGIIDDDVLYYGQKEEQNDTAYALPNTDIWRQAWATHVGCPAPKGNETVAPTHKTVEYSYSGKNATRLEWDCPRGTVVGVTPPLMGHFWMTSANGFWDQTPVDIIPFFERFQLNESQLEKLN